MSRNPRIGNQEVTLYYLIPFDGTLDWANIINNLKDNGYQGPVTLELCYRYDYLKDGINNFYKKGYEAAYKLQELFEKE